MRIEGNLGDVIHNALAILGITTERVEQWVGKPCGCIERISKLNSLGRWAVRVIAGKTERAEEFLERIINTKE